MADTIEKKTYLINVESNLPKYTEDAAKAKEKVDALKESNDELKASGTASAVEIEQSNAALRNAQKEYTQAKKLVDLQTQANNANANSRKQLSAIITLEQQRLGDLANQYVINDKGQRVLSQDYIESVKRLKDAKDAVISYDKAQSDGRSSIGLYSEAINGALGKLGSLPGTLGTAAKGVQTFGAATKAAFISNPIGIIIAVIIGAVTGLVAIFKKFEPVVEAVQRAMTGLKAVFSGVSNMIIGLVTGQKSLKESFAGLGASIKNAYDEGVKWKQLEKDLQDMTSTNAVADAKRKTQMDELLLASRNRSKSEEERQALIGQALLLEEVQFNERKKIADAQVSLAEQTLTKGRAFTAEELKLLREKGVAYAIEMQKKKNISDEEVKAYSDALVNQEQVNNESINLREKAQTRLDTLDDQRIAKLEKVKKAKEEADKKDRDDFKKWTDYWDKKDKLEDDEIKKAQDKFNAYWDEKDKIDAERAKSNIEAGWEYQKLRAEGNINETEKILDAEYLSMKGSTEYLQAERNQQLLIDEKYNKAKRDLSLTRIEIQNKEYSSMASALGSMSDLVGKQTALGKGFAIAEATMNTWVAASQALADKTIPSTVARVALMISIIAQGMANVRNILAVDTSGRSGGGSSSASMPTSITNAPAVQRVYAPAVGSSLLNNPQLSQGQLNSLPGAGGLTTEQLVAAFKKLPNPQVSVEDINARTKEANKVAVRATI
jgi:hypothetical protein